MFGFWEIVENEHQAWVLVQKMCLSDIFWQSVWLDYMKTILVWWRRLGYSLSVCVHCTGISVFLMLMKTIRHTFPDGLFMHVQPTAMKSSRHLCQTSARKVKVALTYLLCKIFLLLSMWNWCVLLDLVVTLINRPKCACKGQHISAWE